MQEQFTCSICLESMIENANIINSSRCGHIYHEECLKGHILNCVDSKNIPIKCPGS